MGGSFGALVVWNNTPETLNVWLKHTNLVEGGYVNDLAPGEVYNFKVDHVHFTVHAAASRGAATRITQDMVNMSIGKTAAAVVGGTALAVLFPFLAVEALLLGTAVAVGTQAMKEEEKKDTAFTIPAVKHSVRADGNTLLRIDKILKKNSKYKFRIEVLKLSTMELEMQGKKLRRYPNPEMETTDDVALNDDVKGVEEITKVSDMSESSVVFSEANNPTQQPPPPAGYAPGTPAGGAVL